MTVVPSELPGSDLVAAGIDGLRRGELTVEALLVAVGTRRLRGAGMEIPNVPDLPDAPELVLYAALGRTHPGDAHSRYNGLVRRLVSFERALEQSRRCRRDDAPIAARGVSQSEDRDTS